MDKVVMHVRLINSIKLATLYLKKTTSKTLLKSSIYTFGYMLGVELLDGYSTEWGFSIYDVIGNGLGTFLYSFKNLNLRVNPLK